MCVWAGALCFYPFTEAETLDTLKYRAVPPPKLFSRDPRLLATYQRRVVVLVKGQKRQMYLKLKMEKLGSYDCLLKAIRATSALWWLKALSEVVAGLMVKWLHLKHLNILKGPRNCVWPISISQSRPRSLSLPPPSSLSYKLWPIDT